jgi:hypothetical protein
MKHTIYDDPTTHKFALIRVPSTFEEGGKLPIPPTVHCLDTWSRRSQPCRLCWTRTKTVLSSSTPCQLITSLKR